MAQGGHFILVRAEAPVGSTWHSASAADAGNGEGVDWSLVLTWKQEYGGGRRGAARKGRCARGGRVQTPPDEIFPLAAAEIPGELCMSSPTGPRVGLRVTFLATFLVMRGYD
jgi:hypothetical protein